MGHKEDKHSLRDILVAEEKYSATLWNGSATGSFLGTEHLDGERKNQQKAHSDEKSKGLDSRAGSDN
jgi:hypothetical protein